MPDAGIEQASGRLLRELGPDAVLTALVATEGHVALPALRRGRDEAETLVTAVAGPHTRGVPVDWRAFFAADGEEPPVRGSSLCSISRT